MNNDSRDHKMYTFLYSGLCNDFEKYLIQERGRHLANVLNIYKPKSVLEVGPGTNSVALLYNYFDRLTVIEPSIEMCSELVGSQACKNHIDAGKIIDYFCSEFTDELSLDSKYDFVVLSSVLHEIADPAGTLKAIKQYCHPETIIYINVPNANSVHRLIAYEAGIISSLDEISARGIKFFTQNVYTIKSLTGLLNNTGFDVIEVAGIVFKPFTHAQLDRIFSGLSDYEAARIFNGMSNFVKHIPEYAAEISLTCRLISS